MWKLVISWLSGSNWLLYRHYPSYSNNQTTAYFNHIEKYIWSGTSVYCFVVLPNNPIWHQQVQKPTTWVLIEKRQEKKHTLEVLPLLLAQWTKQANILNYEKEKKSSVIGKLVYPILKDNSNPKNLIPYKYLKLFK